MLISLVSPRIRKEAHLQALLWWRAACFQPPLSPQWKGGIFQITKLLSKIFKNRHVTTKVCEVREGIILVFKFRLFYHNFLACVAFPFLVKMPLSQPMSFLTFTFLILSSVLLWGQWVSSCMGLSGQLGLNHDTHLYIMQVENSHWGD